MVKTVNIPVSRLSVAQVIKEINKHVEGRNVQGIFFNPTSLLKGTLEIHTTAPTVVEKPVIQEVEVPVEVIKEVPLKIVNQVKKQRGASSQYRGVCKKGSRWYAMIQVDKKKHWCGSYLSEMTAAEAYEKKAYELLGDKAVLNFPENYTKGAK